MINIELLKLWLLKKASGYALSFLSSLPEKVINYFETIKIKKQELEDYRAALVNKQLTEEQKIENDINFLD